MGFLSGLMGKSKTEVPASGFYSMPSEYQGAYNSILGNVNRGVNNINAQTYTPLAQTADETAAFDAIRQGFAPTQESISADVGMFMNPYEQYVMDPINRAAQSDYSILKQDMNAAGQLGSNRQMLGANDIENTRLNNLGALRGNMYNQSISNVLNSVIPQRQQDAAGLLGIGEFQRGLDAQNKQAETQALAAQMGLLGGIPTQFGNFGNQATTVKTGSSLGGLLNTAGQLASTYAMFSDRRLKQDIEHIGQENGHNVYRYKYIGDDVEYVGVMADEVEKKNPEAISEENGFKTVDYDKIGVEFRTWH